MANLQDLGTIANDTAFQNRCMAALEQAAVNVLAEGDDVALHAARAAFASEVVGHQNQVAALAVAEAVLSNSTIAAEATVASLPGCTAVPDSDIAFAINSLFNDLAGIQA
jgi:hypothetical protein